MLTAPDRDADLAIGVEAMHKRELALAAAERAGFDALVATTPATVRWLLCGRGRPVDVRSVDYPVVLRRDGAYVLHRDIEGPRVLMEEQLEQLGYERVPFAWHAGPEQTIAELVSGADAATDAELEAGLARHRRTLLESERARYREAGAMAAAAVATALHALEPEWSELYAAGALAEHLHDGGLVPHVVLVAGEARQPIHRHPLPTEATLGRHALLAVTAERDGLFASLTRLVSFGPPPPQLARLARTAAEVDAAVLRASRPGARLGDLLDVVAAAYAGHGFPDEWRLHHQGGLTGYLGREVFATPGEETALPPSCAVAWNPSITGGAKSEDTVLVSDDVLEVITATPELPALEIDGIARPAIVEL
jgi:Xaa-Pro aminopeptidase